MLGDMLLGSAIAHQPLSSPPAVVARSRRILKFIQKVQKSKVQKFHFSQKVALFDFSGKNSKRRTFRNKLHFSTFRAVVHFSTFRARIQKVALFAKSCTFRLFGQFSHFSTFRAKIQKVALFATSCTFRLFGQFFTFRLFGQKFRKSHFLQKVVFFSLFEFSVSFLTLRLFGQKIRKSHFSQKVPLLNFSGSFLTFRKTLHFSTFRAVFSLFDFSGKNSKSRTFRKKLHFLTFRAKIQKVALFAKSCTFRLFGQLFTFRLFGQKFRKSHFLQKVVFFSLFDFSGRNSKSRTFRKKLHFSMSIYPLFNPKYGIWDMSPTRQYLSIRPVSAPSAADIGYGNIGYCPTSVSTSPPFPARNTGYGICTLRVRIYLSAPSAADIRCGILPHGRRCRIGYGM